MSILAILAATILVAAVGSAVDLSNAQRVHSELQYAADSAAMTAAREFRRNRDEPAARKLATALFSATAANVGATMGDIKVSVGDESGGEKVSSRIDADFTVDNGFLGIVGISTSDGSVAASAMLDPGVDLYVSLLIDSTGSMGGVIEAIKDAADDIADGVHAALHAQGLATNSIFVTVAYFRDLRFPESALAWRESPVYDLSDPVQLAALKAFVASEEPAAGGDTPESSLAAISHALTAPRPAVLSGKNLLHTIVLWSDTGSIPLSDDDLDSTAFKDWGVAMSAVDDITVSLWRDQGGIDKRTEGYEFLGYAYSAPWPHPDGSGLMLAPGVVEEYVEADFETGWPVGRYGCCNSLDKLETEWRSGGVTGIASRQLGLYVQTDAYPWERLSHWENVYVESYTSPDAAILIENIVSAVLGAPPTLRRTR